MIEKIGMFSTEIVTSLNLDIPVGTAIYIGKSNIEHMKHTHPRDFEVYFDRLERIISAPDYVGINQSDGSIELIKTFGKYVKLAVRIANDGEYYARSLYSINSKRVENFIRAGKLIVIDKNKNI